MTDLYEILLTTEIGGSQFTCCVWDPRTGAALMNYRGGGAAKSHGLSILDNKFLITSNTNKPLLHIWPINSQEELQNVRYVIPGKAAAIAVSPDSTFLIAAVEETLYVWQICSGRMINALSKHYQTISTLKFTDDGSHIISAGNDGIVLVWNFTQILSKKDSEQQILYTFNDHALPVTDVHVGCGGIRSIMCSVSMDRTCRLYELASGSCLLNLVFESALSSVKLNILETMVFVGSVTGSIYEFNISSPPRNREFHVADKSVDKFTGHSNAVTCLSLSLDGITLASGGKDGKVCLWHIQSKQLIRTLNHKDAITNVCFSFAHKNFFDHENKFTLITANLKRMINKPEDDDIVEVNTTPELSSPPKFVTNTIQGNTTDHTQELENMRRKIEKLQKINKELFEFSVNNIFHQKS